MGVMIRVVGGAHKVRKILEEYVKKVKEYNKQIRHTGFYLEPVKMVPRRDPFGNGRLIKYDYYYGRYWYIYISGKERGRYLYLGTTKPIETLPDPPKNPLDGVKIIYDEEDILIPEEQFEKVKDLFKGYPKLRETWW
ncbi:MAG: hypothetical protein QXQ57_04980 [Sulfolobales archaeon]